MGAVVVLSLEVGGRAYRWAQATITIFAGDGEEETIPGGLGSVDVDEAGEDSPGGATVEWDPLPLDFARLASQGVPLPGLVAEVAQISEGQRWAAREVLVYGRVLEGTYGEAGEVASAQLGSVWLDAGLIPPGDAVADGAYVEQSRGQPLPTVVGKPTGAPAVLYDTSGSGIAVIAGHPVYATTVYVRDRGTRPAGPWVSCAVYQLALGSRYVAAVSLAGVPQGATTVAEVEPEVDWSRSEGGHLRVSAGVGCPRTLPDVAAVILSYASVPVDRASLAGATWAEAYLLDLYLDDPAPPVDVLTDMLEGIPARIEAGPRGLRLVPTAAARLPAAPGRLVDLDSGGRETIDGGVSVEGGGAPAIITVRYRPDSVGDLTRATAQPEGTGPRVSRRTATYALGEAAEQAEIELPYVCDDNTAYRIRGDALRERASRRTLAWTVPLDDLADRVAEHVRVSRAALYLDAHPAFIEAIERDFEAGTAAVVARLVDDPPDGS